MAYTAPVFSDAAYICHNGETHCFCVLSDNHSPAKRKPDQVVEYDSYQAQCCRCGYVALYKVRMERIS
jgi:hypothetical protein